MKSDTTSQRYYLLDGVRGIAAFAVVAYHWPFIWMYRGDVRFEPDLMPLWWLLSPIQHHGSLAVDLFFRFLVLCFLQFMGTRLQMAELLREGILLPGSRGYIHCI